MSRRATLYRLAVFTTADVLLLLHPTYYYYYYCRSTTNQRATKIEETNEYSLVEYKTFNREMNWQAISKVEGILATNDILIILNDNASNFIYLNRLITVDL